jgi:molecular chaperone Hsp33
MSETDADGALADDLVLPFRAEASGVMGRVVRLGTVADRILKGHDYPEPVNALLGEALCLTALLGAALKPGAKLILQTKTDGPVSTLVVQNDGPGSLRGYAAFDAARVGASKGGSLLGLGHLAMTIDPGGDRDRYQGIVALEGQSLADAALDYFRQSEQLPTFLRLAVGKHYATDAQGERGWLWRAGGLMLQHLSPEGGTPPVQDRLKGDGTGYEQDDDWERTRMLAATVEDHELIDPDLSAERLLLRLFHEEGVRAYGAKPVEARCGCSRERLGKIMTQFGKDELDDMIVDGQIELTCEFCSTRYRFTPGELGS